MRKLAATAVGMCVVAAVAASCAVPASAAPNVRAAGLQAAVDQAVASGFPAAIAYGRDGDTVTRVASGVADLATGEPARVGDRFRIASNTKAFVATVLLQLVGEHRLALDDSVEKWLPGVIDGAGNDGGAITVRQLLNQTSGLYDPTTDPAFFAPYLQGGDRGFVHTPRQVVALAVAHPPLAAPGAAWNYSNTNYLVAGLVIEAVTGRSAGQEIHDRLLVPLALTHTTLPLTDPQIHGPHLHGYDLDRNDMTTFSPSYDWTAGAMISTLDDLARFDRALFTGRLLPPAEQRELETVVQLPDSPGYALGVQQSTLDCQGRSVPVWETDGGGPGFTSISLTTADGSRQLILVGTVFDLGKDLLHQRPFPQTDAISTAQTAAICT